VREELFIVGPSCSVKTTLVSILLGLIKPTRGSVLVDGKNINSDVGRWHQTLGYVPQDMFLLDDTIRNNICLGISQSAQADTRLSQVLDTAGIAEFVRSLPKGLETRVGERGTQISGGQRQRIGLARALFRAPKILILDEATSGLDRDTERTVLENIFSNEPQLTMILVTHRLETAQLCKQMIEIREGRVRQLSSAYQAAE
jgi:ABC-type bacteriocin/lantibiotic exporter with double-glycine peptidase domain